MGWKEQKKNNPPVTGQTTSYYANDDGDLGSPLSYTDNGDGTVTDNITDLVWQQDGSGSEQSLQDGIDYCVNNEASLPGSGWRLPNYKELASIVDHGRLNPSIDPVFTNTGTGVYMSSTTYIANTDNMWIVSFYNSLIYDDYPKTAPFGSYRVRCVR